MAHSFVENGSRSIMIKDGRLGTAIRFLLYERRAAPESWNGCREFDELLEHLASSLNVEGAGCMNVGLTPYLASAPAKATFQGLILAALQRVDAFDEDISAAAMSEIAGAADEYPNGILREPLRNALTQLLGLVL